MFSFLSKKRKSVAKSSRFQPRVESLEDRLNLAGAVTALLAGPSLFLNGNNLDNEIRIEGTAAGAFTVSGVNGTTLNGVNNGSLNFTKIQNIFVDLRNGNDVATVVSAQLAGMLRFVGGNGNDELLFGEFNNENQTIANLQAIMGEGNDFVEVEGENNFSVPGSVLATLGNGNNTFDIDPNVNLTLGVTSITAGTGFDFLDFGDGTVNAKSMALSLGSGGSNVFLDGEVTITGALTVIAGAGDDNVNPGDGGGTNFVLNGSAAFNLGDGNNSVDFEHTNTTITGALSVVTGSGNDSITSFGNNLTVLAASLITGNGNDTIQLSANATLVRSSLAIDTGAGLDTLVAFAVTVNGATSVNMGEGIDLVFVDNSRFRGVVTMLTGGGNDDVSIEDGGENDGIGTRFDSVVSIDLGAGNDDLFVGFDANDFVTTSSTVIVNGGLGNDFLFASGFDVFAFAPILISIT
ncbi:hypothetical protein NA78x_005760 [Anatilimnocola sp. NA78]|uniref:hypothetical protein n=1 Tax=Anatilimnocola sp. NA78 TaxID=3415683 RepID=UPI003CE4F8B1